jgi:TetR/AcrR family transcriptional repressor of nem operon
LELLNKWLPIGGDHSMARLREFDIDEALDVAMRTFWQKGYEATSMDELAERMKLKKGSIYKAYGNKHSLFLKALERYLQINYTHFKSQLQANKSPYQALKHFFETVLVDFSLQSETPCGCFATNALVEKANHDADVAILVDKQRTRLEKLFKDCLIAAQSRKEIRQDINMDDMAAVLYVFVSALMADSKAAHGRKRTEKLAVTLMDTLKG